MAYIKTKIINGTKSTIMPDDPQMLNSLAFEKKYMFKKAKIDKRRIRRRRIKRRLTRVYAVEQHLQTICPLIDNAIICQTES